MLAWLLFFFAPVLPLFLFPSHSLPLLLSFSSFAFRFKNPETGEIKPQDFHAQPIPPYRIAEAKQQADILGSGVYTEFPFVEAARPVTSDVHALILNQCWKPALTITGADGVREFFELILFFIPPFGFSLASFPTLHSPFSLVASY